MSFLMRFPGFKMKAVTLSYDDGCVYDKRLVEIMSKYGIKGTFNINSGLFATESGGRKLTAAECVELYTSSCNEVAVHGEKHLSLANVDSAEAVRDIIRDRDALEDLFGCIIKGMAYANGSCNDDVVNMMKYCGIEYSRTTVSTEKFDIPTDWLRMPATCHHNCPRLPELTRSFVELSPHGYYWRNRPQLFYLWGHSYEFNDNDNWHVIEDFCREIGGRDDIFYATNGEIYSYVSAFNSLRVSANGKIVHNPTATDVFLYTVGKDVKVEAGKTVTLD